MQSKDDRVDRKRLFHRIKLLAFNLKSVYIVQTTYTQLIKKITKISSGLIGNKLKVVKRLGYYHTSFS